MSERVDRLFGSPEVRARIVDALREACRVNAERYEESFGDNSWTFGTSVAQSTYHFVREQLTGPGADFGLQIDRPRNAFRVRTPGCAIYFYKSGPDVHRLQFSRSLTKTGIVDYNQQTLPGINLQDAEFVDGWDQSVVVAYIASPFEGLQKAFAGAPSSDGKRGSPWAWLDGIYVKGFEGPDVDFGFGKPDGPKAGPGSPQVFLRKRDTEAEF